jgi:hypothetical protein
MVQVKTPVENSLIKPGIARIFCIKARIFELFVAASV